MHIAVPTYVDEQSVHYVDVEGNNAVFKLSAFRATYVRAYDDRA